MAPLHPPASSVYLTRPPRRRRDASFSRLTHPAPRWPGPVLARGRAPSRTVLRGFLGRLVIISPHCDDAVFSCGGLLESHPQSQVITVCAGRPPSGQSLTEWDRAAGFHPGEDVMGARREEDRRALALLLARPLWLEFCDSQYRRPSTLDDVVDALTEAMAQAEPTAVFFPLGLFHDDHKLAHEAGLRLMRRYPWPAWFAYEDAIYRRIRGLVNDRLTKLEAAGFMPTLVMGGPRSASDLKRKAIGCYRSQLRALSTPGRPGYQDALAEERFWHLVFYHDRVE